MKPITPKQAMDARKTQPDAVIKSFNEMIIEKWAGYSATIRQDEIAERIARKLDCSVDEVFDRHYLDIEDIFQAAGWAVLYDKPGYNETYIPFFRFTKRSHS